MMCNGGVPPPVILGIEAYQLYMNLMINYWQFWGKISGWDLYLEALKEQSES